MKLLTAKRARRMFKAAGFVGLSFRSWARRALILAHVTGKLSRIVGGAR